jgi:hypothetical protein
MTTTIIVIRKLFFVGSHILANKALNNAIFIFIIIIIVLIILDNLFLSSIYTITYNNLYVQKVEQ